MRLNLVLMLALIVAPCSVYAQQQREPTFDEVLAAKVAVEGQRDFAQVQAQNANVTAQTFGRENAVLKARIAELEKLCGEACKAKAEKK